MPSAIQYDRRMDIEESTPLLDNNSSTNKTEGWSYWRFYNPESPLYRFFLLIIICFIPFGGHFVKNCMSSLEQFLLDDVELQLTNTEYGALISAVSLPNMIIPFWGGAYLDKKGHVGIVCFLLATVIGQILFTVGIMYKSFWFALFGRIVFGVGEGSVVVGSRVIVSHWFASSELTFAVGVTVAISNVSKMLAKSSVAPVALYFNDYNAALWYSVGVCAFSMVMGLLVIYLTHRLKVYITKQNKTKSVEVPHHIKIFGACQVLEKTPSRRVCENRQTLQNMNKNTLKKLSPLFWTLALLHVVFINVFHLFQNVSSSYLQQNFGYSVVKAGYVSSLSHSLVIFAPAIGLFVDFLGGRLFIVLVSAMLSILAYTLLIFSSITPVVSMVLMSSCLSFTPTILMASIPVVVQPNIFGVAFGVVEIVDAVGAALGNLVIGYLRDLTGNYDLDMKLLLGLAVAALCLTVTLIFQDKGAGNILHKATTKASRSVSFIDDDESLPCMDLAQNIESGVDLRQTPLEFQPHEGCQSFKRCEGCPRKC